MNLGLKDKTAFVAASSQGLGKSVAMELAQEGANIIICGRNLNTLELTKKEIQKASDVSIDMVVGDLSQSKDRDRMIAEILKKHAAIDILVTNSGGPPAGKFEDFQKEDWDDAYEQLLASAVHLITGFLPAMKKQAWGRIISITSQAVKQPVDNLILSNSVRAAVVGLIKTLANELGPFNITVNNVMPGFTKTERLTKLLAANPALSKAIDTIPLGRFGQPEEFSAAVAFLASERASYITGTSLAVDGGCVKNIL